MALNWTDKKFFITFTRLFKKINYIEKTILMRTFFITLIISLSFVPIFAQQDAQYSHNMFNHMMTNPGYAGMGGKICATAIQRNQWMGMEGAPTTTGLTVHMPISPFGTQSGVGLIIENDLIGAEQNFRMRAAYSYHLPVSTGMLGLGLDLGMFNRNFKDEEWRTPDTGAASDPSIPIGEDKNIMAFDMAFGAFYRTEQFYAGFSTNHITKPKLKYDSDTKASEVKSNLTRHFFLTAGYNIPLSIPLLELKPSVFMKLEGSSKSSQYDLNILAIYNQKFWGGFTYRFQDAIVAMVGTEIYTGTDSGVRVGIAYDVTTSKLRKAGNNTFEFMISYCFDLGIERLPSRHKSIRYF